MLDDVGTDHEERTTMTEIPDLAVALYSAVVSKMPQLPEDAEHRERWRQTLVEELEAATAIVGDNVAVRLAAEMAEAEFLATFYGQEGVAAAGRCMRYGSLLAVAEGSHRLWLPVLHDNGARSTTVEEAQKLWRQHGHEDLSLYHPKGFLYDNHGMELYRSPMLTHEAGRGLRVAQQARGCIGERVLIYKMKESYKGTEFKVIARIERCDPLPAEAAAKPARNGRGRTLKPGPADAVPADAPQPAQFRADTQKQGAAQERSVDVPTDGTFQSYAQLRDAASAAGYPSDVVLAAYKHASQSVPGPEALALAWQELTSQAAA